MKKLFQTLAKHRIQSICGERIYEGKISKVQPYRHEIANAALEFIEKIVVDKN